MLVTIDDTRMPVGIAVCVWKINGEIRQFVILPFQVKDRPLVEVEVPGNIEVISPAMPEWTSTKVGFGDDSAGYPMDKPTMKDLYRVWDDGSGVDPEASARLYAAFTKIIDHYKNEANLYLETLAKDRYDQATNEAKRNGWDVGLIKFEKQAFPYYSQG